MRLIGATLMAALAAALSPLLRADPGDTDNSRDYPGFTRPPGFIITDYTEDNPAVFDFSIARPTVTDSDHVDVIHVTGHRYVIRYAPGSGNPPVSLFLMQRYYERLAQLAGYSIEKTGATGDVNETYLLRKPGRAVWISLEPGASAYILTVMETIQPPPPPLIAAAPAPPSSSPPAPATTSPPPATAPVPSASTGAEDPLYMALLKNGHVELPVSFLPARSEVDGNAQPVINRLVAMMKRHADLLLTIEGHTDGTGDPDYNKTLSLQRARTVRSMVVAGGIRRARLLATGLGGDDPIADDSTAEGRELNRRIELIVRKP
ncbi:MAG TPA: OmpA family protein [Candidatus Methylacidiphilales bacterium]|nr:OmpA family protein [Candidatus Methylacidiphilales bacterium]